MVCSAETNLTVLFTKVLPWDRRKALIGSILYKSVMPKVSRQNDVLVRYLLRDSGRGLQSSLCFMLHPQIVGTV